MLKLIMTDKLIQILDFINLGKSDEAKSMILKNYAHYVYRIRNKYKIDSETKIMLLFHLSIEQLIKLISEKKVIINTNEDFAAEMMGVIGDFYYKLTNGKNFLYQYDEIVKYLPAVERETNRRLLEKPFGKELFQKHLKRVKFNDNVPIKYYFKALRELPLYAGKIIDKKKASYDVMIKCHDLIIFRYLLDADYEIILKEINEIHSGTLKNKNSAKNQLSKCIKKIIALAKELYNEDNKQK